MNIHNFQTMNHLLSILLIYTLHIQSCDGFASMFVDQKASCWLDIRDTESEVIMNNLIQSPDKSPHGNDVSIELYDAEAMKPIEIKNVGDKRIVYIEDFTKNTGVEKAMMRFVLKLNVKDHPDLGDLQYVMDAKVLPELDEEALDKLDGTEARMTAEFPRKSGCRKLRSHGRKGDSGLEFKVGIPASVFSLDNVHEHAVDVVAGWACGHEAVTLTQPIEFRPLIQSETDKEEEGMNDDILPPEEEEGDNRNHMSTDAEKDIPEGKDEETIQILKDIIHGGGISAGLRARHKQEVIQRIHEYKKHHEEENDPHHHLNLKKFNKLYEQNKFGQGSFTSSNHVKGIVVVLLLALILLKCCLPRNRRQKGRRNL